MQSERLTAKEIKDMLKRKRQVEREEKQKRNELEKRYKQIEREKKKALSKGECLKYMDVCMDEGISEDCKNSIISLLDDNGIAYEIHCQPLANMISFWRRTTDLEENDGKVHYKTKETLEDPVIIWLPVADFLTLVNCQVQKRSGRETDGSETLVEFVRNATVTLENRPITLIIQGLEAYFSEKKKKASKKKMDNFAVNVSKLEVDQILVELQIHTSCNIRLHEQHLDVAKSVLQFTKAIAEAPSKQGRINTDFSFHIESQKSFKVDRNGTGLSQIWKEQIFAFTNVGVNTANAIVAKYPSPALLFKAYQNAQSEIAKMNLLANIEVRREYGPVSSVRKVGPELSRRMYQLFSSTNPGFVL